MSMIRRHAASASLDRHRFQTEHGAASKVGALPLCRGNPLLDAYHRVGGALGPGRDALVARYAFAVPNEEALDLVAGLVTGGLVEVGAGTGYWAHQLHEMGVDVVAYDLEPPPAPANRWFAGSRPWFPVLAADETVVTRHADRTLLLVWPTRREAWAAHAVQLFHAAGGRRLIFVGEGPGGRTGDDALHALLGNLDRCWTCAYSIADAPCICALESLWERIASVELPHWDGMYDDLYVYERLDLKS